MKSVNILPVILSGPQLLAIAPLPHETALLDQARKLYDLGFHDHALLNQWNASMHYPRRRVAFYLRSLSISERKLPMIEDGPGMRVRSGGAHRWSP